VGTDHPPWRNPGSTQQTREKGLLYKSRGFHSSAGAVRTAQPKSGSRGATYPGLPGSISLDFVPRKRNSGTSGHQQHHESLAALVSARLDTHLVPDQGLLSSARAPHSSQWCQRPISTTLSTASSPPFRAALDLPATPPNTQMPGDFHWISTAAGHSEGDQAGDEEFSGGGDACGDDGDEGATRPAAWDRKARRRRRRRENCRAKRASDLAEAQVAARALTMDVLAVAQSINEYAHTVAGTGADEDSPGALDTIGPSDSCLEKNKMD
jgi:hypothetical protein